MRYKENSGITLIALVVTIIVLLILAGISLAMLTGPNGLINKAIQAGESTEIEQIRERIRLAVTEAAMKEMGKVTYSNLEEQMEKEFGTGKYEIKETGNKDEWKVIAFTSKNKEVYEIVTATGISNVTRGEITEGDSGIALKYEVVRKEGYSVVRLYPRIEDSNTYGDYVTDIIYGKSEEERKELLIEVLNEGERQRKEENDEYEPMYFSSFEELAQFFYDEEELSEVYDDLDEFIREISRYENFVQFLIRNRIIKPEGYDFEQEEISKEFSIIFDGMNIAEGDTVLPYEEYEVFESGVYECILESEGKSVRGEIEVKVNVGGDIDYEDIGNIFNYTKDGWITGIKKKYLNNIHYVEPGSLNKGMIASLDMSNLNIAINGGEGTCSLKVEVGSSLEIPNRIGDIEIIGIERCAFSGINNLKSVVISDGIQRIRYGAFEDCGNLKEIIIPNSVVEIEDFAFCNCKQLTSVTISNNITTIQYATFSGCSKLTNIEIPNSVNDIESRAFSGCVGLTSIEIPNSVTVIGGEAFSGCMGLTSIEIPNSVAVIESEAFSGCSGITSIEIPNSVNYVHSGAFYGCRNLANIIILGDNTRIYGGAFDNTLWYENLSDGNIYIGNRYYKYKGEMSPNTSISIKDGTTYICSKAFDNCNNLTSVEIPNTVKNIGDKAFYGCTGLTNIEIPNSVENIGYSAFEKCTSLININIPNSIGEIEEDAFYNTPWYNNLPNGDVYIGSIYYEYKGKMPNNTSISIREGTTMIADKAFKFCSGLINIDIPSGVTEIGDWAFMSCYNLTNIEMPSSITSIGIGAFKGCSGITSIEIPENLKGISGSAFENCSGLTSIKIPSSVTTIGSSAFVFCTNLTDIYCEASAQPYMWNYNWLAGCSANVHWGQTGP